jgi:hypothetical protein
MLPKEDGSVANMIVNAVCIKSSLKKKWVLVTAVALRRGILAAPRSSYTSTALVHVSK